VKVQLPQRFDYDLLPRFDGVAWFRREITLPENITKTSMTIHIGRIDDESIVYLNGKKLGENLQEYLAKPEILRPGKNVIAIRIKDYWERGGFLDPVADFKMRSGKWEQTLAGEWKMGIGNLSFMWIRTPSAHPNLLYNGMLSPIFNYPFKGAIWYQGENNVLFARQYRDVIPVMISDWRKHFCSGDFPFYLVQLPNMNSINSDSQHGGSDWAELRESQTAALKIPNTGMAVTIDLGDSSNIHPTDKTEVGRRLANLALKNTYLQTMDEVNSPMMLEAKFEGNKVVVSFKNTGSGLVVHNKYGYLKGFEVAGSDHKFHFAKAVIQGNQVIVGCDQVSNPVALRYAWSNNPSDANLYNKEGLPAAPFRTDDWKLITDGSNYQNWIK
jgi:sialate O-acetylesterase